MKGMTPEQLAMLASSSNGSSSINMAEILGSADGNPQAIQMMLAQAANPQLTQQARKLYVGNLPVGIAINEQMLTEFFNSTVTRLGITTPNPVLSSWRSSEGTFCFVEFRSVQDTTTCLTLLQGVTLGGRSLRVGRPAGYKPPPPQFANYIVGCPSSTFKPPSIPPGLNTTMSSLVGADLGITNPLLTSMQGLSQVKQESSPAPTKVLLLLHMVTAEELMDDDEFSDIVLDIREECEKFGTVEQIVIPRPIGKETENENGGDNITGPRVGIGVGRIFIKYNGVKGSTAAKEALNGRTFNSNRVAASFYSEDNFTKKIYV